ncbi:TPA: hypothetical protein VGT17_005443 [Vibrio harveyi]|nr:hypothetical protein [Vibrio harveyi]HEQ3599475.1 hypothetical protein [Vibrio harveyi]HEQ3611519.1 hypothetical protein [Vibrio harveyi]
MKYLEEFELAIERSRRLKLSDTHFKPLEAKYCSEKNLESCLEFLNYKYNPLKVSDLVGQCLNIHTQLMKAVEHFYGVPPIFTIGSITFGGNTYFELTEDDITSIISDRSPSVKANIHAWLTLPSLEILDFTFISTYESQTGESDLPKVVSQFAEDLKPHIQYHPVLTGEESLEKLGFYQARI